MTAARYWVELFDSGQRLGGGFFLTRRYVVTALHCLRGLTSPDGRLDVVLTDGSRLAGEVCRRDEDADLALITIAAAYDVRLSIPRAGTARRGDDWHAPYRPEAIEPVLGGKVDDGTADYPCEGGAVIQALQLTVDQQTGDYSGYSGGPVVTGVPDSAEPALVGILLEQVPDRVSAGRAANVLFAATIGEALSRFDQFHVEHLIDVLDPGGSAKRAELAGTAAAESSFDRVRAWAQRGLLDPSQVAELNFMIAKTALERQLRGDGT
ncbi:trypsin-like peptidase domain-containing protein [Streptomyces sp. NPDC048290]|uniref:trypsin-like peptidase domain-containing protein n=1 Tax=Streptomyces sp. NPDC048290 TaxID=3155811 RepID=UPI00341A3FBA